MKFEPLRQFIGLKLHMLAGRVHPDYDFRALSFSATIETGIGLVLHDDERAGLPLWYQHPQYARIQPTKGTSETL